MFPRNSSGLPPINSFEHRHGALVSVGLTFGRSGFKSQLGHSDPQITLAWSLLAKGHHVGNGRRNISVSCEVG